MTHIVKFHDRIKTAERHVDRKEIFANRETEQSPVYILDELSMFYNC